MYIDLGTVINAYRLGTVINVYRSRDSNKCI